MDGKEPAIEEKTPTVAMQEIASMTPFTAQDLTGEQFSRGHMLGGAGAVVEAAPAAPWIANMG